MNLRIAKVALWSGLGAALVVTAYLLVNTTFMPYDDEGYVLISLRNYLDGLRLYDDVFSQYGPWPYVYHELITLVLQTTMTHELGRALTVFHWVGMALLCGLLGWRLTHSQLAAGASALIVFGLTWQNTSEPSHPGSHTSLLVALSAVIVSYLPGTRRPWAAYACLGIIAGLLLLTKINVGLLLAAGLGCLVLRYTRWPDRWRSATATLAVAGLLAIPWVLLGRQLALGWVLILALQFTLAAAGLLWVSVPRPAETTLPVRAWAAAPLAAILVAGLICLRISQHGTAFESQLEAVLINPLRMPAHFMVGLNWLPEIWALTLVGVLANFKAGLDIRSQGQPARSSVWLIVGLRVLTLMAFVIRAHLWPSYWGIFHFAAYCLPLLLIFVVPLASNHDSALRLARWGIACVALPQVLHAFPVAGSQLAWATFLCVPVFMAGLFELREVLPSLLPSAGRRLSQAGGVMLAMAAVGQLGLLAHTGWQRYANSRPLDLPGAGDIRLNGDTRHTFRLLNLNAGVHADLLFSRQGMFSHNIWSGVPTPTAQNATHWFWLLDDNQQRAIADRLASTRRTAFITSGFLDEFMSEHKIPVDGPLQDFVQQHYRALFSYGDFTFHVPKDSHAITFGRYELLEPAVDDGTVLFRSHVRFEGQPVRIRLEMIRFPWASGPDLLTPRAQAVAEPVDHEGRSVGEAVALPSATSLRGLYRLSVICPRLPPKFPWQDYALIVQGPDGKLLSDSVY